MKKCIALFFLLAPAAAFAQNAGREDLWVSPSAETSLFTLSSAAFGGGIALGYGSGAAIGIKTACFADADGLTTLELSILLRFYLYGGLSISGPFIQLSGGPAFFAPGDGNFTLPAEFGAVSAGLSFGWRFLVGNSFFLEGAVRAGYPYIVSGGVSAGFRF